MVTFNPSVANTSITTLAINTMIIGGGVPASVYENEVFNVNCILRDATSGLPIVGRTIDFYYIQGGPSVYLGSQVTGAAGDVALAVSIPTLGSTEIRYEFTGDATYDPSSAQDGPFEVLSSEIATTVTVSAPASVEVNELFEVSGQLRRNDTTEGLVGYTIGFVYNGTSLGPVVTGGGGFYALTVSVPVKGSFTITASFAGSAELGASEAEQGVTVGVVPPEWIVPVIIGGLAVAVFLIAKKL